MATDRPFDRPKEHRDAIAQQQKATASAHISAVALIYPEWSLFVFRKSNPLRHSCLVLSNWIWFDRFILFCILCNCVTLGMSSNREGFEDTGLGRTLNKLEYLWVAIFGAEALIKIISMGFILAPGSYLRDGWNVVDFLVVLLGFVDLFMSGNLTALRTVRVLRPLRAITRVRGIKVLVTTMLGSLPILLDVLGLCALTFFVWGLVAVQLFAGVLRYRCGVPVFDGAFTAPAADGRPVLYNVSYVVPGDAAGDMCSGPLSAGTTWYDTYGSPTALSGPTGRGYVCEAGTFCTMYGNPNYGMTSFDNILWAWLTIFQCITLEAWTDVLYDTSDAVTWWVWPFFVALVVFGSFYMLSLTLAVLFVQFSSQTRVGGGVTEAGVAAGTGKPGGSEQRRRGGGGNDDCDSSNDEDEDEEEEVKGAKVGSNAYAAALGRGPAGEEQQQQQQEKNTFRRVAYAVAISTQLTHLTAVLILLNTVVLCINWYGMPYSVERATNYINYALTLYFVVEMAIKLTGLGFKSYFADGMNVFDFIVVVVSLAELVLDLLPYVSGIGPLSVLRMLRLLRVFRLARSWKELYWVVTAIFKSISSTGYLLLLMLLFMFIAALMGMQLFGYKFMFCGYVDGAAAVCPPGQEVWGQCPNHFYCYLPCTADQYDTWIDAPGSFYNDLAYCQRFCPSSSSSAIVSSAAAAGTSGSGNATAAGTAAAVGEVGSCEYLAMVGKSAVPRANFDNVLWGMFSVFQLLTGENWNTVMYDGMRSTTPWSGLYFIAVLMIGTYLVFNLFIAILLENFTGTFSAVGDGSNHPPSLSAAPAADVASKQLQHQQEQHGQRPQLLATRPRPSWYDSDEDEEDESEEDERFGGGGARQQSQQLREKSLPASASAPEGAPATFGAGKAPAPRSKHRTDTESPADTDADADTDAGKGQCDGGGGGDPCRTGAAAALPRYELGGGRPGAGAPEGLCFRAAPEASAAATAGADADAAVASASSATSVGAGTAAAPPSSDRLGGGGELRPEAALPTSPQGPAGSPSVPSPGMEGVLPAAEGSLGCAVEEGQRGGEAGTAAAPGGSGAAAGRGVAGEHARGSGGGKEGRGIRARVRAVRRNQVVPAEGRPQPSWAAGAVAETAAAAGSAGSAETGAAVAQQWSPATPTAVRDHPPRPLMWPSEGTYSAAAAGGGNGGGEGATDSFAGAPRSSPPGRGRLRGDGHSQAQECSGGKGERDGDQAAAATTKQEEDDDDDDSSANGPLPLPLPLPLPPLPPHHRHPQPSQHQLGSGGPDTQACAPGPPRTEQDSNSKPGAGTEIPSSGSWLPILRPIRRSEHLAPMIQGRSLGLMGPDSALRWAAGRLVHDTRFEGAVMVLILASSVALALDTPSLEPSSALGRTLRYLDYVFTGAFTIEAALKIVAYGLLLTGPSAYLRSGWNVLDFGIVAVGWAYIGVTAAGVEEDSLKTLRVLRTLRALRPLRAASRFDGLRMVVTALFAVLPGMANVALVCVLFYIVFAILAVNLFQGQLFNCVDLDSGDRLDPFYVMPPGQEMTRQWCETGSVTVGGITSYFDGTNVTMPPYNLSTAWVNPTSNFDNVGVAILSLFQVATLELWVDITFTAVDAAGVDRQPLWNNHPAVVLYFIVFIIVCSFFVLNLFVGITLEKFAELHRAQNASSVFMTPEQLDWVDVQRLLLRARMQPRPVRPAESPAWRGVLFDAVTSPAFGNGILVAILVNIVFMALVHADMTKSWQDVMSYSNLAFTAVFVLEAGLKIAAFGLRGYFRDGWNIFDFFVVIVSLASVGLDFSTVQNLSFMPVLRVLRIVRIVRLIKRAPGLQRLLVTLLHSLPALANVGGLMLLFFAVYAIIGMSLFGGLRQRDYLNRHANFNNFPNAMLVLMRMITGESWNGIMQDCMNNSDCVLVTTTVTVTPTTHSSAHTPTTLSAGTYLDPSSPLLPLLPPGSTDNQCPLSPVVAVLYFPSFLILCGFILLNLVIAIILETMISAEDAEALPVSESMVAQFVDAWAALDPNATGSISAGQLPEVIAAVEPPLGTGRRAGRAAVLAVIMAVDIPVHAGNQVTFLETLHALAGRVAGTELPEIEEEALMLRYLKRLALPTAHPGATHTGTPGPLAAIGSQAAARTTAGDPAKAPSKGCIGGLGTENYVTSSNAAGSGGGGDEGGDTDGGSAPGGGGDWFYFPKYTAAHFHAALYVKAAVLGFLARHRLRDLAGVAGGRGGGGGVAAAGWGTGKGSGDGGGKQHPCQHTCHQRAKQL